MELRNRDGRSVDPVPFVVVAGLALMLTLSLGPLYGMAYGLSLRAAVAVSAGTSLAMVAAAYHRLVRIARPEPGGAATPVRAQRLLYAALAFAAVVVGISLPLVR